MKSRIWFNLLAVLFIALALSSGPLPIHLTQAQELDSGEVIQGTSLGTAFTYQGRLTNTAGVPVTGPCSFRFTLYESASGADQVSTPQTKSSVALNDGYFTVSLDFGAGAFTGGGRFLKVEVDCGSGYTALDPRVELTPAPYTLHAVSAGALHGRQVSDSPPAIGDVLQWDGSSWLPASSGTGNAWSLTGNSGTTSGTNFLGTIDNQALQFHVNGTRALRLEPHASSPNLIGGYNGNSVSASAVGATIGGGGLSGKPNVVTDTFGVIGGGYGNIAGLAATVGGGQENVVTGIHATVGGGYQNIASGDTATIGGGRGNTATGHYATVCGGYDNTATGYYATVAGGLDNTAAPGYHPTVSGGVNNTASGHYATVPGGKEATAALYGQWAYASGGFNFITGTAQTSVYVMRNTSVGATWTDLSLDGYSQLLVLGDGRTLTFDILLAGRSDAGESAGYYIWGVAENVGGTTTVWATTMTLHEDDANWDARAVANDLIDTLIVQVMGNGETIRWVATVRTAEVAW